MFNAPPQNVLEDFFCYLFLALSLPSKLGSFQTRIGCMPQHNGRTGEWKWGVGERAICKEFRQKSKEVPYELFHIPRLSTTGEHWRRWHFYPGWPLLGGPPELDKGGFLPHPDRAGDQPHRPASGIGTCVFTSLGSTAANTSEFICLV